MNNQSKMSTLSESIENIKLLLEYYQIYGHLQVPIGYKANGKDLGKVLIQTRKRYAEKKLPTKYVSLYEKMGINLNTAEGILNLPCSKIDDETGRYAMAHGCPNIKKSCSSFRDNCGYR